MTKIDFHYLFLHYLSCFAFLEPVFFTIVGENFFLHSWSNNQLSCRILRKIFTMRAGDYERIINLIDLKKFLSHLLDKKFLVILTSLFSCNKETSKNPKKIMKIANIEEENLHIFWTTWGTSMKVLGKMWLMTMLKVTEKQAFKLTLKNAFLEKPQGGSIGTPQLFKG